MSYGFSGSGSGNLTTEQKDQLIEWFFHRINPDQREELAGSLPAAYNAYNGREVVQVTSVDNPERVWRTSRTELIDGHFVKVLHHE